ncbi:hypothetical protein [Chryseobacterium lathyri]|nr:hypothetical protein [Chryseobacterium lathyri]MDQ0067558.1 hypothetical protein [Chryseobacterium lathyri]
MINNEKKYRTLSFGAGNLVDDVILGKLILASKKISINPISTGS